MKTTMNKRDIAKYHNMLDHDIKLKEISQTLGVAPSTLAKFTKEAIKKSKQKQSYSEEKIIPKKEDISPAKDKS